MTTDVRGSKRRSLVHFGVVSGLAQLKHLKQISWKNSYFPAPSLSFNGQFKVSLFFPWWKRWISNNKGREGKFFFFFFLRHEHVFIFRKVKLSFACKQLVDVVRDCVSLWKTNWVWLDIKFTPSFGRWLLSYDSFLSFCRNYFDFQLFLLCRPLKTNKSRRNWSKLFLYFETRNSVRNVKQMSWIKSYFQPRNMYHTLPIPSLSFSGQFNVLLFFLGEKDEFTMTRPGKGKEKKKLKTYCLC